MQDTTHFVWEVNSLHEDVVNTGGSGLQAGEYLLL